MGNFALQTSPCSFLKLRISPWENSTSLSPLFLFPLACLPFSLHQWPIPLLPSILSTRFPPSPSPPSLGSAQAAAHGRSGAEVGPWRHARLDQQPGEPARSEAQRRRQAARANGSGRRGRLSPNASERFQAAAARCWPWHATARVDPGAVRKRAGGGPGVRSGAWLAAARVSQAGGAAARTQREQARAAGVQERRWQRIQAEQAMGAGAVRARGRAEARRSGGPSERQRRQCSAGDACWRAGAGVRPVVQGWSRARWNRSRSGYIAWFGNATACAGASSAGR
jgi:hypothetical protein